jgi:hypothetical protein
MLKTLFLKNTRDQGLPLMRATRDSACPSSIGVPGRLLCVPPKQGAMYWGFYFYAWRGPPVRLG